MPHMKAIIQYVLEPGDRVRIGPTGMDAEWTVERCGRIWRHEGQAFQMVNVSRADTGYRMDHILVRVVPEWSSIPNRIGIQEATPDQLLDWESEQDSNANAG